MIMTDEKREALKAFNEQQNDWRARCRLCGQELSGTLVELRAHKCEVKNEL